MNLPLGFGDGSLLEVVFLLRSRVAATTTEAATILGSPQNTGTSTTPPMFRLFEGYLS